MIFMVIYHDGFTQFYQDGSTAYRATSQKSNPKGMGELSALNKVYQRANRVQFLRSSVSPVSVMYVFFFVKRRVHEMVRLIHPDANFCIQSFTA